MTSRRDSGRQQANSIHGSVCGDLPGWCGGGGHCGVASGPASGSGRKQFSEYGRRTAEMMWGWATAASDLFAAGEKVSEAALEARGKKRGTD
jgi:hypothetical protein